MNTHILFLNDSALLVGPEHVIEAICVALKAALPANAKDRLCIHTKSAPKVHDGAEEAGKAVHSILDQWVRCGYFDQYEPDFAIEWRTNNPQFYGADGTPIKVGKLYRVNGGDAYGYAGVCTEINNTNHTAFLNMQTLTDGWHSVSDLIDGTKSAGPL